MKRIEPDEEGVRHLVQGTVIERPEQTKAQSGEIEFVLIGLIRVRIQL
jgi:hypothetical protein